LVSPIVTDPGDPEGVGSRKADVGDALTALDALGGAEVNETPNRPAGGYWQQSGGRTEAAGAS
jgi:hypothetical protein